MTNMNEVNAQGFNNSLKGSKIQGQKLTEDCVLAESAGELDISNCQFKKLTLQKAKGFLRFEGCAIDELVLGRNACMKRAVEFEDCQFKNVCFAQAAKIARLCFVNCTFGNGAPQRPKLNLNLEAVTIKGGGRISLLWDTRQLKLTFDAEKCEFGELEFAGGSSGLQAVKMRFERCLFKRSVHLNSICFTSSIEFNACRFHKYVDCSSTHFSSVSFHDSVFEQKAYFNNTCFGNGNCGLAANFSEVTFEEGADFERSIFRGKVTFSKAVFYEATTFTDIRLCEGKNGDPKDDLLVFASAQIFGFVGFRKGRKKLGEVTACNQSDGDKSLSGGCCECSWQGRASLRVFECGTQGSEKPLPLSVDFQNIYISSIRGLRFHSVNLEKCKVVGTNLDACYFNDVRWPTTKINLVHEIYRIYDHCEFLSRSKDSDGDEWSNQCARLSKAYRDLKLAYELDKDYIYASDFHFSEKELRRINPEVPWPTKVQLNLFWLINGYGERALRPVGLLLLVILAGALVYWDGGLSRPQEEVYRVSVNGESLLEKSELVVSRSSPRGDGKDWYRCEKTEMCWWESVAYSAATTVFLKPDFLVLPEGFSPARVMSWFQTIAGPALFGMFALAIRNKLKR